MTTSRITLIAAAAAVGLWTLKAVAIGVAGGLGLSPVEGPLFLAGLVSFAVAAFSLGVSVAAGSAAWLRAASGVGALVGGFGAFLLVDGLVAALARPEASGHWVWAELNLWILGAVGLLVALAVHHRRRPAAVALA